MRGPSKHSGFRPTSRHRWWSIFTCLALYLTLHIPATAQQQPTPPRSTQLPSAPISQSTPGSISGTVTDPDGAIIAGATIILSRDSQTASEAPQQDRQTTSGADGRFSFPNLIPGPYKLTTSAPRLSSLQTPLLLHPGENYEATDISLPAASLAIDMQVTASQQDIAQAQIQAEEKQRIFGAIPNFYVSYVPNPVPLTSKQKFELAWKTLIDPITFTATGFIAGIEQAQDDFGGYGQGTQGYAKRYAAAYGNAIVGTAIGNAILPSILKQDPRYFYR